MAATKKLFFAVLMRSVRRRGYRVFVVLRASPAEEALVLELHKSGAFAPLPAGGAPAMGVRLRPPSVYLMRG